MGAVFDHVKGAAERRVIDRLGYWAYQARVNMAVLALAQEWGCSGRVLSPALLTDLHRAAVAGLYVAGDFVAEPPEEAGHGA